MDSIAFFYEHRENMPKFISISDFQLGFKHEKLEGREYAISLFKETNEINIIFFKDNIFFESTFAFNYAETGFRLEEFHFYCFDYWFRRKDLKVFKKNYPNEYDDLILITSEFINYIKNHNKFRLKFLTNEDVSSIFNCYRKEVF